MAQRNKGIFLGRGDPDIDCLAWYLSPDGKIEGWDRSELSMSMHIECAQDPRTYLPDKVREKALAHIAITEKQTFDKCQIDGCPNSAVIHKGNQHYCQECALENLPDY